MFLPTLYDLRLLMIWAIYCVNLKLQDQQRFWCLFNYDGAQVVWCERQKHIIFKSKNKSKTTHTHTHACTHAHTHTHTHTHTHNHHHHHYHHHHHQLQRFTLPWKPGSLNHVIKHISNNQSSEICLATQLTNLNSTSISFEHINFCSFKMKRSVLCMMVGALLLYAKLDLWGSQRLWGEFQEPAAACLQAIARSADNSLHQISANFSCLCCHKVCNVCEATSVDPVCVNQSNQLLTILQTCTKI